MSVTDVVTDLIELQVLAENEDDLGRRRSLAKVLERLAHRERGAKVSEAAKVLGVSQPTVRAWIGASVLTCTADAKPVRVDVLALAETKRALDLVREHIDDQQLLVHVMRILRDRAALEGSAEAFDELRAGRLVPLGEDLRAEIAALPKRDVGRRSKGR